MTSCRLLGHRYRFSADGAVMRWECERGCGASGAKVYESPATASRFAAVFDREDRDNLGGRAPWFALFPLRLWHKARRRSERAT